MTLRRAPRTVVATALVSAAAAVTGLCLTGWIRGFEQGQTWFPNAHGYLVFLPHALVLLFLLTRAPGWLGLAVAWLHVAGAAVMVPIAGFGLAVLPGALLLVMAAARCRRVVGVA